MSNNIGGNNVTPGMADPEVAVNDRTGRLDAALSETLALDVTTADKTPTVNQLQSVIRIALLSGSSLHALILTPIKHLWVIEVTGSGPAKIKMGATEITLAAGNSGLFYADGTTDGLRAQGVGTSSPGDGETGGGIEEPPADGKLYVRKRLSGETVGIWVEYVPGSGGGDPGDGGSDPGAKSPHKAWRLRVDSSNYTDATALGSCQFRTTAGTNEPASNFEGTNFGFPMIGSQYDRVMDDNIYTIGVWQDGAYPKYVGRIYTNPKAVLELALYSYNDTYTPNCLPRHPASGALEFSDDTTNLVDGTWHTALTFTGQAWTLSEEIKLFQVV